MIPLRSTNFSHTSASRKASPCGEHCDLLLMDVTPKVISGHGLFVKPSLKKNELLQFKRLNMSLTPLYKYKNRKKKKSPVSLCSPQDVQRRQSNEDLPCHIQ